MQKPSAVLLLVGDGVLRPDMEQKAQALGLGDRVIFTGVRGDVPDLMQAMDCFVFPSLYEGIPVTLIEAQAAGLPCVVSDGIPVEARKTDLVTHIPLSRGCADWAANVLEKFGMPREDTLSQIRSSGYDIEENAAFLQQFYLERADLKSEE